ncbi:hypothetical protein NEOLEDRAFT_1139291 [Neolentinus lepideus HHB14362 ss-1]|uniref:Uncharacterized protein n=1 Tax=Neolentinus lepideus HHB14362 ss-1 TaxID=1314782 RepID=A0A165PT54_9AGAM|nr:hypothetical protein NEOLEDRAFT_1139291 [Neolentinus lepideus HHB14362 ss-1]
MIEDILQMPLIQQSNKTNDDWENTTVDASSELDMQPHSAADGQGGDVVVRRQILRTLNYNSGKRRRQSPDHQLDTSSLRPTPLTSQIVQV